MAKRTSPLFHRLFKKVGSPLVALKHKMFGEKKTALALESIPAHASASLSSYEQEQNMTQWALAETSDKDNKNKTVVMVQIEAFPHTSSGLSTEQLVLKNYTIEGEDPNLRITHYPSNRLH